MVIASGKDVHQGIPLIEHRMHGFMLIGVLGGSVAALLITSEIYAKK